MQNDRSVLKRDGETKDKEALPLLQLGVFSRIEVCRQACSHQCGCPSISQC